MIIQSLNIEDIAESLALQRASITELCTANYPKELCTLWANTLKEKDFLRMSEGQYYKLEKEGTLIAIGGFEADNLKLFYIHPKHIGQGIATRFFKAIEEEYLHHNPKHLHVISTLTALPFYLRMGFVKVQQYFQPLTANVALPTWILTKTYPQGI